MAELINLLNNYNSGVAGSSAKLEHIRTDKCELPVTVEFRCEGMTCLSVSGAV